MHVCCCYTACSAQQVVGVAPVYTHTRVVRNATVLHCDQCTHCCVCNCDDYREAHINIVSVLYTVCLFHVLCHTAALPPNRHQTCTVCVCCLLFITAIKPRVGSKYKFLVSWCNWHVLVLLDCFVLGQYQNSRHTDWGDAEVTAGRPADDGNATSIHTSSHNILVHNQRQRVHDACTTQGRR